MASANATSDVSKKLKATIKAKLLELGVYVDDELPDYIMLLVTNKKPKEIMKDNLSLFMGKNTEPFVDWLFEIFERLQSTAHTGGNPIDAISNSNVSSDVLKIFDDICKKVPDKQEAHNKPKPQSVPTTAVQIEKKSKNERSSSKKKEEKDSTSRKKKDVDEMASDLDKSKRRAHFNSSDEQQSRKRSHYLVDREPHLNLGHKSNKESSRTSKSSRSEVFRYSSSRNYRRDHNSKMDYRKHYDERDVHLSETKQEKLRSRKFSPCHESDREEDSVNKEPSFDVVDKKVASSAVSKMSEPGSPAKVSSTILVKRTLPETPTKDKTGAKRLFLKAIKGVNEPVPVNHPPVQDSNAASSTKKHPDVEPMEITTHLNETKVKDHKLSDIIDANMNHSHNKELSIASENENFAVNAERISQLNPSQRDSAKRAPKIMVTLTRNPRDRLSRRVTERIAKKDVRAPEYRMPRRELVSKRPKQRSFLSARMRMYKKLIKNQTTNPNHNVRRTKRRTYEKAERKENCVKKEVTNTPVKKKPRVSVSIFDKQFDLDDDSDSENEAKIDATIASMNDKKTDYSDKMFEAVALRTKSEIKENNHIYRNSNLAHNDSSPLETAMSRYSLVPCRYGGSCRNSRCLYQHPKLCRFAERCTNNDCPYRHVKPLETIASALRKKYIWQASNNA